uniref:Uncharacterized protein n=2 Tax=Anguilla anguilla TaxID=7936 RepID=A0A0E9VPX4_ANGAN
MGYFGNMVGLRRYQPKLYRCAYSYMPKWVNQLQWRRWAVIG